MAQTWSIEAFAEEIGGGFIGNISMSYYDRVYSDLISSSTETICPCKKYLKNYR